MLNSTIVQYDENGFCTKMQGSTCAAPADKSIGFVFATKALEIAQDNARNKPWSRWFPEEETICTSEAMQKPKTKAQQRIELLRLMGVIQ